MSFFRLRLTREIFFVACGLIVIGCLTTLVTPYRNPSQYSLAATRADIPTYYRAQIIKLSGETARIRLLDGPDKNSVSSLDVSAAKQNIALSSGSQIIVSHVSSANQTYSFTDRFRIPSLIMATALFVALVLLVGRRRGATSLVGLGVSVLVIFWGVIPLILAGVDALLVVFCAAYVIAFSSIVIAHGFKYRTYLSLGCVACILLIVALFAKIGVIWLGLTGVTDEQTLYFALDHSRIDMAGVLIGGIIIASLGVLDDIVTAQVATVDEIQKANPALGVKELIRRSLSVGGEHIAALVNTLVLVFVGASLPSLVALAYYSSNTFLLFNGSFIATEIIRTLVASSGLVIAVPVSTCLAAFLLHRRWVKASARNA